MSLTHDIYSLQQYKQNMKIEIDCGCFEYQDLNSYENDHDQK